MSPAEILAAAGLTITEGMTTPSRPGKKPRPVWEVRGNVAPWEPLFKGLGGRPWRGAMSFFDDPTDAIADAIASENADETLTGTYRERREARAERLREWSSKRERKSAAAFNTARTIADAIPFGQPILVGHHSEKRARRDQSRIHSNMSKGCEHADKAREMASRADNIEHAAERAIYSDDVDAVDRLREKCEGLEAERERIKACNKAIRKHGLAALLKEGTPFELTPAERAELLQLMKLCPYHQVETRGFPPYALTNLGGNITRNRARLQELEAKAAGRAKVRALIADAAVTADLVTEQDFGENNEPRAALTISYGSTEIHREPGPDPVAAVAEEIAHAEANAGELAEVPYSLTPECERRTPKNGGLF